MIDFRENEKVYIIQRRHKFVLWRNAASALLVFLIILVSGTVLIFSDVSWPEWLAEALPALAEINLKAFLLFSLSVLFLVFWIVLFVIIAVYYLDCWIVTNERTIHTELKGLFNRLTSTVQHDKIQDISVEIKGILPTFLRYGNLYIQTAGGFRKFVCRDIPEPQKLKDLIFKAQNEFLKQQRGRY